MPAIDADLQTAVAMLRDGGIGAMPTETVYGLAGSAFNPQAIARIFEVKQRPSFDPLIVHIAEMAQLTLVACDVPDRAWQVMKQFWPGPLTVVLPKRDEVADLVSAGLPTVGVRMPGHDLARELIRAAGVPLAAPSANPFGGISPTTAAHVREALGDKIDFILDGGPCQTGVESTVIGFDEQGRCHLFRPGGLALEELEKVVGKIQPIKQVDGGAKKASLPSPGMTQRHYAPRTGMILLDKLDEASLKKAVGDLSREGVAGLGFDEPAAASLRAVAMRVEVLSANGDMKEAAANLFAAMRRLDTTDCSRIIAHRVPMHGLGAAINDRLRRASQPLD